LVRLSRLLVRLAEVGAAVAEELKVKVKLAVERQEYPVL
jgi:hypothetical protein